MIGLNQPLFGSTAQGYKELQNPEFRSAFYADFFDKLDIRSMRIYYNYWKVTGNPLHFAEQYIALSRYQTDSFVEHLKELTLDDYRALLEMGTYIDNQTFKNLEHKQLFRRVVLLWYAKFKELDLPTEWVTGFKTAKFTDYRLFKLLFKKVKQDYWLDLIRQYNFDESTFKTRCLPYLYKGFQYEIKATKADLPIYDIYKYSNYKGEFSAFKSFFEKFITTSKLQVAMLADATAIMNYFNLNLTSGTLNECIDATIRVNCSKLEEFKNSGCAYAYTDEFYKVIDEFKEEVVKYE